jgi:hypothetical protein
VQKARQYVRNPWSLPEFTDMAIRNLLVLLNNSQPRKNKRGRNRFLHLQAQSLNAEDSTGRKQFFSLDSLLSNGDAMVLKTGLPIIPKRLRFDS